MTIEIHESVVPDTQPKKWVLAGDGVIGEVTCTKEQALAMAAGPELLSACHRVLDYWNGKGRYVDGVDVDDVVKAAIDKAEGSLR